MVKMGPLDEIEMQRYRLLTMKPEDYPRPGEKRECGEYGGN